jgi:hypothetical protein
LKASVDIPLSPRNLRRMRAFYRTYRPTPKPNAIWPPSVAKLEPPNWPAVAESLPWAHHITLMEKVKDPSLREFSIAAAFEHG